MNKQPLQQQARQARTECAKTNGLTWEKPYGFLDTARMSLSQKAVDAKIAVQNQEDLSG